MLSIKKGSSPKTLIKKFKKFKRIEKNKGNWYFRGNDEKITKLKDDYKEISYEEKLRYSDKNTKDKLMAMCDDRCFVCGRIMKDIGDNDDETILTIEHIIPQSVDPKKILKFKNFLPVCLRCNNIRDDKEIKNYVDPRKRKKLHLDFKYKYSGKIVSIKGDEKMVDAYGLNIPNGARSLMEKRRDFLFQLIDENFIAMLQLEKDESTNSYDDPSCKAIVFYDMYLNKIKER